ncbi:MAG: hypothetical protein ACKERF_00195 [Candidatus Hodgkinia cicadicola]
MFRIESGRWSGRRMHLNEMLRDCALFPSMDGSPLYAVRNNERKPAALIHSTEGTFPPAKVDTSNLT